MSCKIKEKKSFKPTEKWFLPPDKISTIKRILEIAVKHSQYSETPTDYFISMSTKLEKIKELEGVEPHCVCGIKHSGNIFYISNKE